MRLFPLFFFLTLVGTAAHAATPDSTPRPTFEQQPTSAEPAADPYTMDTIRLAQPPGTPLDGSPAPLPSRREFSTGRPDWRWQINAGFLGGAVLEKNDNTTASFVGGMAVWTFAPGKAWDFGLDLTSDTWLRLSCGRRWAIGDEVQFAPYWKLALSQTVPSNDFPSGAVNLERVKAMAALGLNDLLEDQEHWNAEFAFGWGMKGTAFQVFIGRNF